MGTQNSKCADKVNTIRTKNRLHSTFDPNCVAPVVTAREKELVEETWVRVKGDISKVGVITFIR